VTSYALSPRAREDLSDIWSYSADRWGDAQADRYIRLIASACEALATGGRRGRRADVIRAGYFRYAVGSHVLFYRMRPRRGIEVVRILHQSMDLRRHL